MTTSRIDVVDRRLTPAVALDAVRRRSVATRLRAALGRPVDASLVGHVYWPIALLRATAVSTGRRQWTERTIGAVDLVSGRIGLVDTEVAVAKEVAVAEGDVIPPRLTRTRALDDWHAYFRDFVDRRRKPMRPPRLTVDSMDRLWLEHAVVSSDDRLYLVDPITERADELTNFPSVERLIDKPSPANHEGAQIR